ncbi:MAG TPA: hypothetical protein VNT75_02085 [Symbiobacteriaceae bacterium]|nr:hypothetical protein [Symbiobacteriaceae bacterium]
MELDLRGTEADVIRQYLTHDMGAVPTGGDRFAGDGWEVTLTLGEHRFYRWVFPRVVVQFDGDPERVKVAYERLRLLAFRGGG